MYSKLYERIKKEYVLTGVLSLNEMEALGIDSDTEFKKLTYSFYDMYIELFESINRGRLDQEIEEYMKDILQSYGETYCNEIFGLPFEKSKIEEVTYWTEEFAKEHVDKMLNIENPKDAKEQNWPEEKLRKLNEWTIEYSKKMVEEGSYLEDYSGVVKRVSEAIANTIDRISYMMSSYSETPLEPDTVRILLLIYLMFDHWEDHLYSVFDDRPNEYIRADLLKLYIEMKRKRIPLGYIPCAIDYQESIDNVYDIYREYDYRWFGMNETERFLQYTEDPTKKGK